LEPAKKTSVDGVDYAPVLQVSFLVE